MSLLKIIGITTLFASGILLYKYHFKTKITPKWTSTIISDTNGLYSFTITDNDLNTYLMKSKNLEDNSRIFSGYDTLCTYTICKISGSGFGILGYPEIHKVTGVI